MRSFALILALVFPSLLAASGPRLALAQGPSSDDLVPALTSITHELDEIDEALAIGDSQTVRHAYDEVHDGWEAVEDRVRAQSPDAYTKIEDRLHTLAALVKAEPLATDQVREAALALDHELDEFMLGAGGTASASSATDAAEATVSHLLTQLNQAGAAARAGDAVGAAAAMKTFQRTWPSVEGSVATRSRDAYQDTEESMVKAYALLTANPPAMAAAIGVIDEMQTRLQPFATVAQYGVMDAVFIMLREGLEALLIIVALLAFLKKSANADKQGWIWLGGGLGILASIVTAIVVQQVFSSALASTNREIIEGVIGLVAAGMLVYVSYWLHGKSQMGAWQKYIRQQSSAALASNSLFSLALISFLAVFREGAETVVFYMGIAPSIALRDLVVGIGLALAILVVIAVLILRFGVRIPMRPFFLVTSLLLYYMAFKFVGMGIHALQVAGIVPATPSPYLPSWGLLGLFPTLETTLVQVVLLLGACAAMYWLRRQSLTLARPA